MPRLLVAFVLICLLCATNRNESARASGQVPTHHVRVLILLRGTPAAAVSQFKDRSRFTHGRMRFDAMLPEVGAYARSLDRYQAEEIAFLRGQGIGLTIERRFHTVLNGFGATVDAGALARLRRVGDVLAVVPERRYTLELDRSVGVIDAPQAWARLGGTSQAGRGTYIADIDSGIDITNPCFRDSGFARPPYGLRTDTQANQRFINNKVVVARAFGNNGDKQYSAADVHGHGTFTASIEACDAGTPTPLGTPVSGVAPGAYLMSYNVFPSGSSGPYDDQVIAAIDSALLDGADVANISLGSPQGIGDLGLDPESAAVQAAVKAGLTVVVAAGNGGPTAQTISSPGGAPDAVTVGAVTNAAGVYSSVLVGGTAPAPGPGSIKARQGSFPWSGSIGPAPLVNVGLGRKPGDDPRAPTANDFAGQDVHGKIVLVQRGGSAPTFPLTIHKKLVNAAAAGAVAAIVYDNQNERYLPQLDQGQSKLPLVLIGKMDGERLVAVLAGHANTAVTVRSALGSYDETAGVLTDFSSRGYGAGYAIKPDLMAPGADIYAATQSSNPSGDMYDPSGFTSQNGTSFAAPHVTGAAALLRQIHPKWTPAMVKAALVDTASPAVSTNETTHQTPQVMEAGSGLLDVAAATVSSAAISPSQVSFGGINIAYGSVARDVPVNLVDAGSGAGTWRVTFQQLHGPDTLALRGPTTIDLPVNGQVSIHVQLDASGDTPEGDYDGYLEVTRGDQTLHIPYFVHIVNHAVQRGTVLLVDDTASRYRSGSQNGLTADSRVAPSFEAALRSLGRSYTYWNEARSGAPALQDMRRATAVIYFTGHNLNGYTPANSDSEALAPPLSPLDVGALRQYLASGGRVFLSGMGVALSDPYWLAATMGARVTTGSLFDNPSNDARRAGGVSPARPSAIADADPAAPKGTGIFMGLKALDLSGRGDGIHDNAAVFNSSVGLVGVAGVQVVQGAITSDLQAHGHAALRSLGARQSAQIATTSNDEPSLGPAQAYRGRAVLFTFGFEGINDNTGYATRVQVLGRILRWFGDVPHARVSRTAAGANSLVRLHVKFSSSAGAAPVAYQWQVGRGSVSTLSSGQSIVLARPARYAVRVRVVDSLGHAAISPWSTVTVRS